MAEPKKKLSRTRTHLRRTAQKASFGAYVLCKNCGKSIMPHQMCPECGFYADKPVKPTAPTKRILAQDKEEDKSSEK